jgi:hypothetical protein
MAATPTHPPQATMMRLLTGHWTAQCIHVAAHLGLADLVKDGPQPGAHLAEATGTHVPSLYRLLRGLASEGIFAEDAEGRFGLTPLAECLRSDRPDSQRALAMMSGEEHYRCWGELLECIRTGQTAFDKLYQKPIFAYLADNPRAAAIFDQAMVGVHGAETAAMLDAYDFAAFGTLVDAGGGNGSLLTATLQRHPRLRAILFDRADVIERARPLLGKAGVADRCTGVAGNFFQSVPPGGDAYLLRHIIHDWDDDQSLTILKNVRQVVPAAGKLLLVEGVVPPGNGPSFTKMLDLNMLVIPGGKERTEAEYRDLYAAAGFRLARIVPTRGEVSVIEGVPA